MQIDPKIAGIVGLWTTFLMAIAGGTIILPLGIPVLWIPVIKSWALFFGTINSGVLTYFHWVSAPKAGPLAGGT